MVDFDGEEEWSIFSWGGVVVRCRGVIEEKSPDFRFPEVGISEYIMGKYPHALNLF